jgi:regulator of sigma E protease
MSKVTENSSSPTPIKDDKANFAVSRKYLRIALFFLFVIVVLFLVIRYIDKFGYALLVMLGFGAVILVHEFGHFIVAKASNIRVEAFSIFMPPILFGIQKTANGIKIRILPEIFPKEGDSTGEGALNFTIGKKGQAGETEYRIGLIPFGGFVKMLGQDDVGPVKDNKDPRSFANKPTRIRVAVIAAGVIFNVISAIIIFMITFLIGIDLQPPVVGGVMPGSSAALAGLKPGDEIVEIAGKRADLDFSNIGIAAALSGKNEEVPMTVKCTDGSERELQLVATKLPGEQMKVFGIEPAASLTIAQLSISDANYLLAKTALQPGDRITSVNGQDIRGNWELMEILRNIISPEATILAERNDKDKQTKQVETKIKLHLNVANVTDVNSSSDLSNVYSIVPRLQIAAVQNTADQPAQDVNTTLQPGDIILAIGDISNPIYTELREVVTQHKDVPVPVKVLRAGTDGRQETVVVTVIPKQQPGSDKILIGVALTLDTVHPVVARTIDTGQEAEKLQIPSGATITVVDGQVVASFYDVVREIKKYKAGDRITIDWRLDEETAGSAALTIGNSEKFITVKSIPVVDIPFAILQRTYKATGPINAIAMGYRRTVMFIAQTYVTLKRLISGLVSPKNLMGPVGIIKLSYQVVSERPLIVYVYFLGMMSAMIAVFNFLPLPPLDGGLAVLMIIEKIKGSALSEKVQTVIAYTGWLFILLLFLYVTFNDILRLLIKGQGDI